MAEFSGIRNENEFYFAHYLTSLMDDELKEVCQNDEMKAAFEKVSKFGLDYHALVEARELVQRHRSAAYAEDRKDYLAKLHAFVCKLADCLGYAGVFTSPGLRIFQGANLTIPVSGILTDKDGGVQALLIESYHDYASSMRYKDEGILENFLSAEQLSVDGIPEASYRELSDRLRGDRSKNQMPTWENLLSNEIFAAPNAPRFVVVFGEDSILLADRTKWAERRTLIFDLDEIYDRGERATFRAMVCLLARSSLAPNGSTPLPDKLDENSHKNAFGVSKSLRYAMREAIEMLGNAILESVKNETADCRGLTPSDPRDKPQIAADCRRCGFDECRRSEECIDTSKNICGNLRQSVVDEGTIRADKLTKECILVMYRFLFVLFLESRKDLGYFETAKGSEDIFWSAYGFDHLRDLETVPLLTDADRSGLYFDKTIKQLFSKIWHGAGGIAVTGDGGQHSDGIDAFRILPLKAHLFDPERTPFFNHANIPNEVWQKIVYSLSIGEAGTGKRKRKGRISYAQLGIQQLGAVYEALLSYTGFHAKEDLYEVQSAGAKGPVVTEDDGQDSDESSDGAAEEAGSASKSDVFETGYFVTADDLKGYTNAEKVENKDGTLVCHKKGSFIYRMAGRDRERSASYYTPEVLTRCLVRLAIKERVTDDMPADEVMKLTVCEPAMGSAAFLNETIDQLADIYLRKKQKELKKTIPIEQYAAEKARVKMVIADNNVFGVDLNPTAADLAEVSLWLGSIGGEKLPTGQDRDEPYIPWFGTQLKCGNSIIGCRREVVFRDGTHKKVGFNEPFPDNAVWHFLIPDEGMAIKLDKVVKGIVGDEVATRIKKWSKAFHLPDKKKKYAEYDKTWKRLSTVSRAIDRIWRSAAEDIKALDERTRDDVAYFGYEPKASSFQDIKTKDRQLNTEISRDEYGNIDYSKSLDSVTDYFKLKTILDLWCSLWFWPLDKTETLPSWEDFETLVGLLARGEFEAPGQMKFDFLGDVKMTTEGKTLADQFNADPTLANLYRLFPFAEVSQSIAERQHFLHWELEFAPVFKERGGFDLIVGNPPWVRLQWNEQGILSEYDPHIAVRKISASDTTQLREGVFAKSPVVKGAYLQEFTDTVGTQAFLSSENNYPSLVGCKSNLFKYFLPLAFRIANCDGVSSFIHPEGVYDDPNGGKLRAKMYPRLRLHAQFRNTLGLFDIDGRNLYSLNVYGPQQEKVAFNTVATLFHPTTLEESLARFVTNCRLPQIATDDTVLPLERTDDGKWNLQGHADRVVPVTDDTLSLFASLYDEAGTPSLEARLPALYTRQFQDCVLKAFSLFPTKMQAYDYVSTICWDETASLKKGIISKHPGFAKESSEVIYSGPLFFVGNPLNKTCRPIVRTNSDYDVVDLLVAGDSYRPRTNFFPAISRSEYESKIPKFNDVPSSRYYRVFTRMMCNASNERTLIPCLMPKDYLHVISAVSYTMETALFAANTCGSWCSVPYDWFMRSTGKNHFLNDVASLLPVLPDSAMIRARALLLNCLNRDYAELWAEAWDEAYLSDSWLSADSHLTKWSDHLVAGKEWKWETPLRTQLDRRQALVELDVIVTKVLGLSLDDLLLMYRVSFPTMRKYDADTYYDQNGRCVFSAKSGESYLSRKEWESIKDMPSGEFKKTITETVFSDTPTERTIVYKAPFFKKCREDDYKEAWEMLEKRGA